MAQSLPSHDGCSFNEEFKIFTHIWKNVLAEKKELNAKVGAACRLRADWAARGWHVIGHEEVGGAWADQAGAAGGGVP